MTSINRAVICCGLEMAPPTTTEYAPKSNTCLAISGVMILPSAMTGMETD